MDLLFDLHNCNRLYLRDGSNFNADLYVYDALVCNYGVFRMDSIVSFANFKATKKRRDNNNSYLNIYIFYGFSYVYPKQ